MPCFLMVVVGETPHQNSAMASGFKLLAKANCTEILQAEEVFRSVDKKRLHAQSDTGDLHAAKDMLITTPRSDQA